MLGFITIQPTAREREVRHLANTTICLADGKAKTRSEAWREEAREEVRREEGEEGGQMIEKFSTVRVLIQIVEAERPNGPHCYYDQELEICWKDDLSLQLEKVIGNGREPAYKGKKSRDHPTGIYHPAQRIGRSD